MNLQILYYNCTYLQDIYNFMKNYNQILTTTLILDFIFVIIYIFVLSDIKEFFSKGYEIGQFMYNLSLSFIAAGIFYYIIDYFPKKSRKIKMLTNMEIHSVRINYNVNNILENFDYPANLTIININNASNENIKELLDNTNYTFKTKVNFANNPNVDILTLIRVKNTEINYELNELEKESDLFSPELYASIKELKRMPISNIFNDGIHMIKEIPNSSQNLGIFSDLLIKYINCVKEFNEEWNKNKTL